MGWVRFALAFVTLVVSSVHGDGAWPWSAGDFSDHSYIGDTPTQYLTPKFSRKMSGTNNLETVTMPMQPSFLLSPKQPSFLQKGEEEKVLQKNYRVFKRWHVCSA